MKTGCKILLVMFALACSGVDRQPLIEAAVDASALDSGGGQAGTGGYATGGSSGHGQVKPKPEAGAQLESGVGDGQAESSVADSASEAAVDAGKEAAVDAGPGCAEGAWTVVVKNISVVCTCGGSWPTESDEVVNIAVTRDSISGFDGKTNDVVFDQSCSTAFTEQNLITQISANAIRTGDKAYSLLFEANGVTGSMTWVYKRSADTEDITFTRTYSITGYKQ